MVSWLESLPEVTGRNRRTIKSMSQVINFKNQNEKCDGASRIDLRAFI